MISESVGVSFIACGSVALNIYLWDHLCDA